MTSACSCLSEDLMIWLDAMKKKMSKSYENRGIYLHCYEKKKAEPFTSLSWRIKLADLQRTG